MIETNNKIQTIKEKVETRQMHYHGDKLRNIYLLMAVIMLISTPFCSAELPVSTTNSVIGILVLSLFAGLTTPKSRFIIVFDFIISLTVLFVFGYQFVNSYSTGFVGVFFYANLVLALLSIAAVYFSSKTLRGHFLIQKQV
jgi:hypothetical protein